MTPKNIFMHNATDVTLQRRRPARDMCQHQCSCEIEETKGIDNEIIKATEQKNRDDEGK